MGGSQRGFSLFELVVFIICVAIIYASAANRFSDFPGEAERANFLAVTAQLQAAVNLELMMGLVASGGNRPMDYTDMNPMTFLLEAPHNYLGELYAPETGDLPRRSWYFDQQTRELVYLINDSEDVFLVEDGIRAPTDEIRFRVEVDYLGQDDRAGSESAPVPGTSPGRLTGMVLRPVTPYIWGTSPTFMEYTGSAVVSG